MCYRPRQTTNFQSFIIISYVLCAMVTVMFTVNNAILLITHKMLVISNIYLNIYIPLGELQQGQQLIYINIYLSSKRLTNIYINFPGLFRQDVVYILCDKYIKSLYSYRKVYIPPLKSRKKNIYRGVVVYIQGSNSGVSYPR